MIGPQTPQAAALAFLQPKFARTHASVRIVARRSDCAVLQFRNALIESNLVSGDIVVKKFRFGWQAIYFTSPSSATINLTACSPGAANQRDVGPPDDVSAVRSFMAGVTETIPFVRVVGNYAFLEWVGNGGGENFYKKSATGWKPFMGGGGAATIGDLTAKGVPLAVAKALLRQ